MTRNLANSLNYFLYIMDFLGKDFSRSALQFYCTIRANPDCLLKSLKEGKSTVQEWFDLFLSFSTVKHAYCDAHSLASTIGIGFFKITCFWIFVEVLAQVYRKIH